MIKILFKITLVVVLFFGIWLTLSEVNWMHLFRIDQATKATEEKLGDLIWEMMSKTDDEMKGEKAVMPIDSIVNMICVSNDIDRSLIKIHVVESDEINAFALPNNHLVVYSGLITASENQAELCGVLGHEIAHMQLNHVMKKLVKEVGLSVIISMTAGNGGETIKEAAKLLSSSAYDRTLEKEADMQAVDYLIKANIDTEPFANFLYRLGESESSTMKYFSWVSTHPDSKERAEYIVEYSGKRAKGSKSVLSDSTWQELKTYVKNR